MKLLLIHTGQRQTSRLAVELSSQGYQVTTASDDNAGLELVNTERYALVLIEALGSGAEGLSLCHRLRSQMCQIPILFIAECVSSDRCVASLEAGADDFLALSSTLTEVLLRIRALLRQDRPPLNMSWRTLRLTLSTGEVYIANQRVLLTPDELRTVQLFLCNPTLVFSHCAIADHLWGFESSPDSNFVTAHINNLRQKLSTVSTDADLIEPVEGNGYRLKALHPECTPDTSTEPNSTKINAIISNYCERFRPEFLTQLKTLEEAAEECSQGLSSELQKNALQDAHRLAGALGIFGYPAGSPLAKEIETLLHQDIKPNSAEAKTLIELVRLLTQMLQQSPKPTEEIIST